MKSIGKSADGNDIIPTGDVLTLHTNVHPNTDGTAWGWIEECTINVCWSDNTTFDREAASELVHLYNSRIR